MSYHFVVLVAVAGLRAWELFHSWRHLRAGTGRGAPVLLPEPGFPVMVAVHGGWWLGCLVEVLVSKPLFHSWIVLPMLALWAVTLGLRFWVIVSLGEEWNVRVVKRKKQTICTDGPYRYVRHPNYLAVVLEIAAVALLVGAYWTALLGSLANAAVLWERIRREEAYLFGFPAYRKDFIGKKRLIPGIF